MMFCVEIQLQVHLNMDDCIWQAKVMQANIKLGSHQNTLQYQLVAAEGVDHYLLERRYGHLMLSMFFLFFFLSGPHVPSFSAI